MWPWANKTRPAATGLLAGDSRAWWTQTGGQPLHFHSLKELSTPPTMTDTKYLGGRQASPHHVMVMQMVVTRLLAHQSSASKSPPQMSSQVGMCICAKLALLSLSSKFFLWFPELGLHVKNTLPTPRVKEELTGELENSQRRRGKDAEVGQHSTLKGRPWL